MIILMGRHVTPGAQMESGVPQVNGIGRRALAYTSWR